MTALKVRKLRWSFDEATPFQWNRAKPRFCLAMNSLSFFAPAFERYIVKATRMAMGEISDAATQEEAAAFLRQEALHAAAHREHTAALVRQHTGLQTVLEESARVSIGCCRRARCVTTWPTSPTSRRPSRRCSP